jgi:hypothetical protein
VNHRATPSQGRLAYALFRRLSTQFFPLKKGSSCGKSKAPDNSASRNAAASWSPSLNRGGTRCVFVAARRQTDGSLPTCGRQELAADAGSGQNALDDATRDRPKANAPTAPSPGLADTCSTKARVAWEAKTIEANSGPFTARRPACPSARHEKPPQRAAKVTKLK